MFLSRAMCAAALLAATSVGQTFAQHFPDIRLDTNPAGASSSDSVQTASAGRNVYVVWHEHRVPGGGSDIYLNRSTDGGATWQANDIRIDNGTAGAFESSFPQITCANSNVYVVWEEIRGGQTQIWFNRSLDFGVTWEVARQLSSAANTDPEHARICCAADCTLPAICSPDSQRVYVVWCDNRSGHRDIFFNHSANSGAAGTWNTERRLDTDQPGAANSQTPQISCVAGVPLIGLPTPSDKVYVVWSDNRDAFPPLAYTGVKGLAPRPRQGTTQHPGILANLYGSDVNADKIILFDTSTGVTTPSTLQQNMHALAFVPAGSSSRVFGSATLLSPVLIGFDYQTGNIIPAETRLLAPTPSHDVHGLAFDPDTQTLFGTTGNGTTSTIITIEWRAGATFGQWEAARSPNGQPMTPLQYALRGLAFDRDTDRLYGSSLTDQLVAIPVTPGPTGQRPRVGVLELIGNIGFDNVEGLAFDDETPGTPSTPGKLYGSITGTAAQIIRIDTTPSAFDLGHPLPGPGYGIRFNRSVDNGLTWDSLDKAVDTAPPSATASNPQIASALKDNGGSHVYIAWQDNRNVFDDIFFARSTDSGATFEADHRVDEVSGNPLNGNSRNPQLVCEPECLLFPICFANTKVYVTWQDDRNGTWDIYFNTSASSGLAATWPDDKRVDDPPVGQDRDAVNPSIAVKAGRVMIAWQDDRNAVSPRFAEDIYCNYSHNLGFLFRPLFDLRLDRAVGNSRNPRVGLSDDGPYAVWLDDRDGINPTFNDDIYFNIPFGARPYFPTSIPLSPDAMSVGSSGIVALGNQVNVHVTGGTQNGFFILAAGFQKTELSLEGFLGPLLIFDFHLVEVLPLNGAGECTRSLLIPAPPVGIPFLDLNLNWQAGELGFTQQGTVIVVSNGLEMWIG